VWERDEGVCGICGTAADLSDWHLDHVVPLSKGGEHSYANTQVSHPVCNLRKHAKVDLVLVAA
jgi:5-methylcytosine-specific restriction endonuclease McrA